MQRIPYTTRGGVKQFRPTMTEAEYRLSRSQDNAGFCLACGEEADQCEPDARQYTCEACGLPKVYGLEELLMMGLLVISEEAA